MVLHKENALHVQPIQQGERIHLLDSIRGVALFGILLANMLFYQEPKFISFGLSPNEWTESYNVAASWFLDLFVVGKFYPMFSILFGIGFAVFLKKAFEKGVKAKGLFAKRLTILLLFGFIHLVFIWSGDILVNYALAGFLLLLFFDLKPKTVLNWARWLFIGFAVLIGFFGIMNAALLEYFPEEIGVTTEVIHDANEVLQTGNYGEVLVFRLVNELPVVILNLILAVPMILPLFLFGLYVTKRIDIFRVQDHLDWVKSIWKKSLVWGIVFTILFAVHKGEVLPIPSFLSLGLADMFRSFSGLALCIFYMTSVTLLVQKQTWQPLFRLFSFPGKMALSNYLFQSFICVTIFYGFGFGLFAKVGPALSILFAIIIYGLQMAVSYYWLKTFQYGPFEWLWRTATYKKRQPMKVKG